MNTVLALVCLLALRLAGSVSDSEWESYKAKHGKFYSDPEVDDIRRHIYAETLEKIKAHNALYDQGKTSYYQGENLFSDMRAEEINSKFKGFKMSSTSGGSVHQMSGTGLPDSIDWRDKNMVTEAKQQGNCGDCWAFGATGAVEGQLAKNSGQLVDLSEQQLLDCVYTDYSCANGSGDHFQAFSYIQQYGQERDSTYPYKTMAGACAYNSAEVVARITGYTSVQEGDEGALQDAIANVGPITVGIDALKDFFQYSGGVYSSPYCSSTSIDHSVLAVGYGTDSDGQQYYIIKNSWGSTWGDQGFGLMSRNNNNMCGIASQAGYPTM